MVTQFRYSVIRGVATCAIALFALVGFLFVLVSGAHAQVQANPPSVNVPATRSASVPVTWELTNTGETPFLSIESTGAQLFFAGPNGSGSLPITRLLTHGPVAPGQTARIRETLVIPQSFLTRVLQAGTSSIGMERFFQVEVATGQFVTAEGNLEINITGGLGAGLQISRVDLRFQNEAVQIIVPQHHPPEVRADITYTGTGLFRAVWEVADPRVTAAGGPPIFRVLRQERIRLGVGTLKRIKGPNLPAQLTGLHIVRFRILDGPLAGEAPIVRYFVKAAAPDGEDWWKRYIRPHQEGEGLVRVPDEPEEELVIDDMTEPEDGTAEPGAGETDGDDGSQTGDSGDTTEEEPAAEEPASEDDEAAEGGEEGDGSEEGADETPPQN